MLVFELGLGLFGIFLAALTYHDFRTTKPSGWKEWGEFGVIVAAQVCLWVVLGNSVLS